MITIKLFGQPDPTITFITAKKDEGKLTLLDTFVWDPYRMARDDKERLLILTKPYCSLQPSGKWLTHRINEFKKFPTYNISKLMDFFDLYSKELFTVYNRTFYALVRDFNINKELLDIRELYTRELDLSHDYFDKSGQTFYIDKYLDYNNRFKSDLVKACSVVGLNSNYEEDLYLLAAFILFGHLSYYTEFIDPYLFIRNKIYKIYHKHQLTETKESVINKFNENIIDFVKSIKNEDELNYILENLMVSRPEVINSISLEFATNINIIHIIYQPFVLLERYIEVTQNINDTIFKKLETFINIETKSPRKISLDEIGVGLGSGLFCNMDDKLSKLIKDKLFCQIPADKIEAKDFRKIFSKFSITKEIYGIRNKKFLASIDNETRELEMINIFMSANLFNYASKYKSSSVISDEELEKIKERDQILRYAIDNEYKLFE